MSNVDIYKDVDVPYWDGDILNGKVVNCRYVDYYTIFKEKLSSDGYLIIEDDNKLSNITGELTESVFVGGGYTLNILDEIYCDLSPYAFVDGYKDGNSIRVKIFLN